MAFVCAAGVSECALAGPALIKGECHHYVQIFKGNAHELATMEDEAFTESVSGIAEPSVRYVVAHDQYGSQMDRLAWCQEVCAEYWACQDFYVTCGMQVLRGCLNIFTSGGTQANIIRCARKSPSQDDSRSMFTPYRFMPSTRPG